MLTTPEFTIEHSSLSFQSGVFHHAHFRLRDERGDERIRAVALKELTYLPIETRDDPDVLGKQWAALRGLYNAGVDFLYTVSGLFAPAHIGVVQFYGAAAEAGSEGAAVAEVERRMAAVEATLANYPLSRLSAPDGRRVQLLYERLQGLPRILAVLGHPDPRLARKGLGRDGSLGEEDDDLASQQGEILLRGLAKLREDFVFLVTAQHIGRGVLSESLVKMAQTASHYASRQRGALSAGFSIAIPLAAALSDAYSGSQGRSESVAASRSDTVSEGWGTGESRSWGHSVGESQSHGLAHTESSAVTDAVSQTSGQSWGESQGHTDSVGHTDSGSHTDSHSTGIANSSGESWSTTNATGRSSSVTDSASTTNASGQSVASNWATGHTEAASQGLARSESANWSAGQSSGVSHSTGMSEGSSWAAGSSQGQSAGVSHAEGSNWSASQSEGMSQGASHGLGTSESVSQASGMNHSAGSSWGTNQSSGASQGMSQGVGVSESVSQGSGMSASQSSGWSAGESSGVSQSAGSSWGESSGTNQGGNISTNQGASVSHSQGISADSGQSSNWSAGSSEGSSQSLGASANAGGGGTLGIPGIASLGANVGGSVNAGVGASQGMNQSVGGGTSSSTGMSSGISTGHSESVNQGATWGTSSGVNVGGSQSMGVSAGQSAGVSGGESFGVSQSAGHSLGTSQSLAQSSSTSQSTGSSAGGSESMGVSHSAGQSAGASESWGQSASVSQAAGSSVGGSQSTGVSSGVSSGTSQSTGGSAGTSSSAGSSSSTSSSVGGGSGSTASTGASQAQSNSVGGSAGQSSSVANSTGRATSSGVSSSTAHSQGGFNSTTNSESWGTADSVGWADSRGSADSTGTNRGWFEATSRSQAVTRGVSDTESWSESVSESWSEGRAVSRSQNWGRAHSDGSAAGQAIALGAGRGFVGGFSAGMVPGVSIARSWQTEDDVAIRLTEIARSLESLLNQASMEGGFLTSALLCVGDRGERAAQALIPQAFHGPAMPTPVLTVPGDESLRAHALAFRPSLAPEANPFAVPLLWSKWGTLLTPGMLAAYTAPNLFEEGTTVTVQEKLPPLAFYSEQKGEVVLGHLVSPETGDLTNVPLRLSRERHFHTAFCGDTGYGKSVAAERLVYETTLHWKLKTIVLDFGAGWRKLMNAPGLEGRVEIRQLSPGGVRPLRWNPLQIGRSILPEVQWRAFCDIFGSIAKLGQRRQVHELRDALRRVYLDAGVLVDDPECRSDPQWGFVREEEMSGGVPSINSGHRLSLSKGFSAQLSDADGEPVGAGTPLAVLNAESRQLLAVHRSKLVGLATLYREIEEKLRTVPPRDSMLRGVLEGILFRLHPLVQGAAAVQYAAGEEAIDLNEIVPGGPTLRHNEEHSPGLPDGWGSIPTDGRGAESAEGRCPELAEGWGVAVLEGGAFLDDFSKAFLLGWAAWHLYTDAVILRMKRGATRPAHIQIVFEEANKILVGLDSTSSEDESGQSTAEQFANMWRDSRKYGIWLHLITQSPSLIPPGILSSCNNIFVSQLKNPRDRDLAVAALHRSEKGFVDEAWRRFLASLPVARTVAKLGYSFDRAQVEPCYIQPLLLDAAEPSDGEIEGMLR
jgi:hypothetical protein